MAAGVSDGAIIIDTGINTGGFIKGARELNRAVQGLESSVNAAGKSMAAGANGYVQALGRAGAAAKSATTNQQQLEREIQKTEAALAKMEEKLELQRKKFEAAREQAVEKAAAEATEKYQGFSEWGAMPDMTEAEAQQEQIELIGDAVQGVLDKFGEFEDTQAFSSTTAEIEFLREKLAGLKAQVVDTKQTMETTVASGAAAAGLRNFGEIVQRAAAGFVKLAGNALRAGASLARMAGGGALSFLRKLAEGAKNATIQLAKLAANALRAGGRAIAKGFKGLGGLISKGAGALLGFNKENNNTNNGLKSGLMAVLKYGLGIRGLFALFRRLRSAISDGLGEIAKRSPEVNRSLNMMKSALNGLKASLGTAFAPIVTAVAPALSKLISMLTSAINTIGAFIAALTGQSSYQKAVGGLEATGSAASSAAGDVEKLNRQLGKFDDLDVLKGKDSSSGGNSGAGGSGGGIQYTTAEISSGITDFVGKLKELWANADYEGIGREIAGAINGAFAKAKDLISWDALGDKITEAVNAITGIFNGLVDNIDWTLIGETLGEGVNTIIRSMNLLLTGVDWENLGKGFGEGLNGLVDTVNWDELGQLFANRINALINTIKGLVKAFKWGDAGTAFATTVNNLIAKVDFDALAEAAATGINGIIAALRLAVNGFDWGYAAGAFTKFMNDLLEGVDFDALAESAATGINKVVTFLRLTVNGFDWGYAAGVFSKFLNDLLTGVDFDALAETAATGINKIVTFLRLAVNGFDWGYAAGAFSKFLNDLFKDINFDEIAGLATDGLNKIVSAMRLTVNGFDWGYAAGAFSKFLNDLLAGINFDELAGLATEGVNKIVSSLRITVNGFDWGYAASAFSSFLNSLISGFDFTELANLATTGINKIVSFLRIAVDGFEWGYASQKFAAFLNSLLTGINFDALAETAADGLNKIISSLRLTLNSFNWGYAGTSFADTVNNFFKDFDWENLGKLAADGIAKPISTLRLAVSNFDWGYAGSSFASTVNGFFSNEQLWKDAAATVSEAIKGLFTWGTEFLNNLNTAQISNDIKAFLQEVDWAGIGKKIFNFLVAAIKAAGSLIVELLKPTPSDIEEEKRQWKKLVAGDEEYDLVFHLNPIFEDEAEIIRQINEAINQGLETGTFVFPAGLDVSQETVDEAERKFLELWYNLHTEAPVVVTPDTTPSELGAEVQGIWSKVPPKDKKLAANTFLVKGSTKDGAQSANGLYSAGDKKVSGAVSLVKGSTKDGAQKANGLYTDEDKLVKGKTVLSKGATSLGAQKANGLYTDTDKLVTGKTVLSKGNKTLGAQKANGLYTDEDKKVTGKTALKKGGKTQGAQTVSGVYSAADKSVTGTVSLAKGWKGSALSTLGIDNLKTTVKVGFKTDSKKDEIQITSGGVSVGTMKMATKALGGIFKNGIWRSIPQYAAGTLRAGSIFAAGEAGPELVGHIGGRTEVLNKSQLASTMYSAVSAGMLNALRHIQFRQPAMATGSVMPYEITAQIAQTGADLRATLDANNEDLIQTIISVAGQIVAVLGNREQGTDNRNSGATAQQIIDEINRRTQMLGRSPLLN